MSASLPTRDDMVARSRARELELELAAGGTRVRAPTLPERVAAAMCKPLDPSPDQPTATLWNCRVSVRGERPGIVKSVQNHLEESGFVVWYEPCACLASGARVAWSPCATHEYMVIDWADWKAEMDELVAQLAARTQYVCAGMPELVARSVASILRERGHSVDVHDQCIYSARWRDAEVEVEAEAPPASCPGTPKYQRSWQ